MTKLERVFISVVAFSIVLLLGVNMYLSDMNKKYTMDILEKEECILQMTKDYDALKYENSKTVYMPVNFSYDDLDLLARLVSAEARGESFDTQKKVASVVMNRLASDKFPKTLTQVIYQENQFSVTSLRASDGILMIDHEAEESARKAAFEVITGGSVLPSKVLVFYASTCTGEWITSREIYGMFDNTIFAYLEGVR